MGHRSVILEFCLPQYPKILVEWIHERNEKVHPVCLHNNGGVLAESSLTCREIHSVLTQQVTEFRLSLSSLHPATTSLARGLAQAGLASALARAGREVEAEAPGVAHVRTPHGCNPQAPGHPPGSWGQSQPGQGFWTPGDGEEQLSPAQKFHHQVCA